MIFFQPASTITNATFIYDADGKRVKSVLYGVTTYFVGAHYEVTGSSITKYYYAGSQRIAMRKNNVLSYVLGDHLGSTSLVTDANGTVINQTKYKAWGETRYSSGTEQTKYTYTGQYSYVSDFGLMYYGARWYDNSLGRFAQADTIIPTSQGVQGYDRYAYTNNNPINNTDPTGHVCFPKPGSKSACSIKPPSSAGSSGTNTTSTQTPPSQLPASTVTPQVNSGQQANSNTLVILACGAGGISCNEPPYGLDSYGQWASNSGYQIFPIDFGSFDLGRKLVIGNMILSKILENSDKSIILIGHSTGADAILIALRDMPSGQNNISKVVLFDPTLSYSTSDGTAYYNELDAIFTTITESGNTFVGTTVISQYQNPLIMSNSTVDYTNAIAASQRYDVNNLTQDQISNIHNLLGSSVALSDVISFIQGK